MLQEVEAKLSKHKKAKKEPSTFQKLKSMYDRHLAEESLAFTLTPAYERRVQQLKCLNLTHHSVKNIPVCIRSTTQHPFTLYLSGGILTSVSLSPGPARSGSAPSSTRRWTRRPTSSASAAASWTRSTTTSTGSSAWGASSGSTRSASSTTWQTRTGTLPKLASLLCTLKTTVVASKLHICLRGDYYCPHCWTQQPPVPSGATLIVSPSSISYQWIEEIQKHIRHRNVRMLFYEVRRSLYILRTCSSSPI